VSVRILDEHDVRRLLPMAECIDVMADALASLAREELHNPLRFVVRPPGEQTLMGLMPAHRSSPAPLYSLKTVVIAPANAARGLDLHQGFVALFDGETGATRAIMKSTVCSGVQAAAGFSLRPCAVSAVNTKPGMNRWALMRWSSVVRSSCCSASVKAFTPAFETL
jgi:ornithine cyclodeaminase